MSAHGPKAVETIHHATMSWNEMARILDVAMALESGFAEIPDLACDGGDDGENRDAGQAERQAQTVTTAGHGHQEPAERRSEQLRR